MNDKKNVIVAVGVVVLIAVIALLFFLLGGKSTYKVTFNSNGGSSVDSQEVNKGDKAIEPTNPTRDGYTFNGWYLSLTDVTPYDFSKEVTENIELIAKWSSNGQPSDTCNLTCAENETLDTDKCECVANTVKPEDPDVDEPQNNTDKVAVTGITLSKSSVSLTVGDTTKITASVKPTNATDKSVTWSSSDTKVATVDKNGNISAKAAGTATITAKSSNGKSATLKVSVTAKSDTKPQDIPVTELNLSTNKVEVEVGATVTVTASVNSDATNKSVSWKSDNENVASVTNGVIKGVSAGTATITVTAGNISKSISVTVKQPAKTEPKYVVTINRQKQDAKNCGDQYIVVVTKDGEPITKYTKITGAINYKNGRGYLDKNNINSGTSVKIYFDDGSSVDANLVKNDKC